MKKCTPVAKAAENCQHTIRMLLVLRIRTGTCESNGHNDLSRLLAVGIHNRFPADICQGGRICTIWRFIWIRFVILGKLGGFLALLDFSLVLTCGIFMRIALLVFSGSTTRGIRDEIILLSDGDLGSSCNVLC